MAKCERACAHWLAQPPERSAGTLACAYQPHTGLTRRASALSTSASEISMQMQKEARRIGLLAALCVQASNKQRKAACVFSVAEVGWLCRTVLFNCRIREVKQACLGFPNDACWFLTKHKSERLRKGVLLDRLDVRGNVVINQITDTEEKLVDPPLHHLGDSRQI